VGKQKEFTGGRSRTSMGKGGEPPKEGMIIPVRKLGQDGGGEYFPSVGGL